MKIVYLLLPVLLPFSLHALINLGESEIDLSVSSGVTYDSEIQARNEGRSDIMLSLGTSLHFQRPSPNFTIGATVGVSALRYLDNSEFDRENYNFNLNISPDVGTDMEGKRFSFSTDVILDFETRSRESLGEILSVLTYGLAAQGEYRVNRRLSLAADIFGRIEDPDSDQYRKIERHGGGIEARFPLWAQTRGQAGISYEQSESDNDTFGAQETISYYVGLSDQLLPKLSGSLNVGLQQRSLEGESGDSTTPYLAGSLNWVINETTGATIRVSNSFNQTFNNLLTESLEVSLAVRRQLNRRWSGSAGVSYRDISYENFLGADRDDETYAANVSLDYQIVRWGSLTLFLRYSDQSSSRERFQFDRLQTGLAFRARW